MYNLTVASMFRDSEVWYNRPIQQAQRFIRQVKADPLFSTTRFLLLEGDSVDNTYEVLHDFASQHHNVELIKKNVGKSFAGSIDTKERMKTLGNLADTLLDKVEGNYLIWVESDLIFDQLLSNLQLSIVTCHSCAFSHDPPAMVAPVVFLHNQQVFYDTWGFVGYDGVHWSNYPPYHTHYQHEPSNSLQRYVAMQSVGSCVIMNADYLRQGCRFGDGAFQGLCKQVRDKHGSIYVDLHTYVYHPSHEWLGSRWI